MAKEKTFFDLPVAEQIKRLVAHLRSMGHSSSFFDPDFDPDAQKTADAEALKNLRAEEAAKAKK